MALPCVIAAALSSCYGLWRFLAIWVHGRAVVALERERNAGTAQALELLPPGSELMECELGGRLRVIRLPMVHGSARSAPRTSPMTFRNDR